MTAAAATAAATKGGCKKRIKRARAGGARVTATVATGFANHFKRIGYFARAAWVTIVTPVKAIPWAIRFYLSPDIGAAAEFAQAIADE